MIAKIKKYTFLVHHRDYISLLNLLREAGIVHVIEKRKIDEESSISDEIKLLKRYRTIIKQLSRMFPGISESEAKEEPLEVLTGLEESLRESELIRHKIEHLKTEASRVKPWGNFDPEMFKKLKEAGWSLSLFACPQKRFNPE